MPPRIQIRTNLPHHPLLGTGQFKRDVLTVIAIEQVSHLRKTHAGDVLGLGLLLFEQLELQQEKLFEL